MGSSQQRNTNHNKKIKWNFKMRIHYPKEKKITAAAAKSLQLCPTLCDPIDGSPPGSPIPGILQARTLEWVVISFSNAWKWKVKVKSLSCVWLLATPWTAAHQAPPSLGFSRQEYWSGAPVPSLTKLCITSIIPILLDIYFKNLCISMHRKERIWSREITCLPEKKHRCWER